MNYYRLISSMSKAPLIVDDALAFITAASITDTTQQNAIIQLVADLKSYGIWTKFKAIYPMVGGVASSHRFNLKSPTTADSSFYLDFFGTWTHSINGAKPNGAEYANTKLLDDSLTTEDMHFSIYSRTNQSEEVWDIGAWNGTQGSFMGAKGGFTEFRAYLQSSNFANINNTDTTGFYIGTRYSSGGSIALYKNGLQVFNGNKTVVGKVNLPYFLGGLNSSGTPSTGSKKELAFVSIGDGLNATQSGNLYTAVQKFNTTLNRYVGIPVVSDTDAQAFINSAVITNITQANALNTLVTDMKTNGLWTKMKAIYPMVGGTAFSHKFNLKDPRDLDAAYRLQFVNGWTHSADGAKPNGTDGFADTNLNASLLQTNNHLAFYSRTATLVPAVDMGVYDFLPAGIICQLNIAGNYISGPIGSSANFTTTTIGNGFWLGTKISDTERRVYLNGTNQALATASYSQTLPSINMYLGARNKGGIAAEIFSNKQCAFASIGDGLTALNVSNLHTAVHTFNTTLSRPY